MHDQGQAGDLVVDPHQVLHPVLMLAEHRAVVGASGEISVGKLILPEAGQEKSGAVQAERGKNMLLHIEVVRGTGHLLACAPTPGVRSRSQQTPIVRETIMADPRVRPSENRRDRDRICLQRR